MSKLLPLACAAFLCAASSMAYAAPPEGEPPPSYTPAERALAAGAAIVPGALVHGTGHLVLGETDTALRLLAAQGAGLVLMVGGIGLIAVTGASPTVISPLIGTVITGTGLFGVSALADLYGTLAPAGGFGTAPTRAPRLTAAVGYAYVQNPVFAYRHFTTASAAARYHRFAAQPSLWLAANDDNWRTTIPLQYRLIGPHADADTHGGDLLQFTLAASHHRYGTEGFSQTLGELSATGRIDLHPYGRTLQGSYAELTLGAAYGANHYDQLATESTSLILGGFAFGMYLGRGAGEARLYYDHRHDDYAAGLKSIGLGSGVPGHFGASIHTTLYGPWGLDAGYEIGSAHVARAALTYRYGDSP